jgi:hypothetical protein
MADVVIETSVSTYTYTLAKRCGIFWASFAVGYVIYGDSLYDLKYRKTGDGGATWGAAVNIRTGRVIRYDCWADWQTVGDVGTKIHIAYLDTDSDDVRYVYLDTSDDTIGGDVQIEACQGTGAFDLSYGPSYHGLSVTKTRGGNLAVVLRYTDTTPLVFYGFYTSPDATTWNSKTAPWEAAADYILLFPGNEADNQDIWATFWDLSADEISLKTYDDSGNSWSEQLISASMVESIGYLQMDGTIRLSDGHLIFAAWDDYGAAANPVDLMVWDINGAGSITAKTNVLTNSVESFLVSVFVNQVNGDIYVAYIKGTDITSLVAAFYQKSVDGGANWGGQAALQADAEDDERWISAGAMKASWGGKFQPFWFNDDLNDLFTNTDNGILISPVSFAVADGELIGIAVIRKS